MSKNIFRVPIDHAIRTFMAILALIFAAIVFIRVMPVEFLPRMEIPTLVVTAWYPAASADSVQTLVSKPLEEALASLPGLKKMESTSRRGIATITLTLQWGSDLTIAGIEARQIIDSQFSRLPSDMAKPTVTAIDPNAQPILSLALLPKSISLVQLRRIAKKEIISELQHVEGVGVVTLFGGIDEEVLISPEIKSLSARGISLESLSQIVSEGHFRYPAGMFTEGSKEYLVVSDAEAKNLPNIEEIPIAGKEGSPPISLKDIASIALHESDQISFCMSGQTEGVGLLVYHRPGSNSVQVAEAIKKVIPDLEIRYGSRFSMTILDDASQEIRGAIDGVSQSLLLGALVACIIIFLFTKNFLLSSILTLSLPVALLLTIAFMGFFNMSLNVMSLGGIAIAVGNLVDSSVVVLEHLERRWRRPAHPGDFIDMVARGVFGSTATAIIVFIPLFFLPGVVGALYKDLALSVSLAQVASMLTAFTVTPLAYVILSKRFPSKKRPSEPAGFRLYRKMLKVLIRKPVKSALLILVPAIATTILAFFIIPINLIPPSWSPIIDIDWSADGNTGLKTIKEKAAFIEKQLHNYAWFDSVWFRIGGESNDTQYLSNPRESSQLLHAHLRLNDNWVNSSAEIRKFISTSLFKNDLNYRIKSPVGKTSMLLGVDTADEKKTLVEAPNRESLSKIRSAFPGPNIEPTGASHEIVAIPKRTLLSAYKANPTMVSQELQAALYGSWPGRIEMNGISYDIHIKPSSNIFNENQITALPVLLPGGGIVSAGTLVEFKDENNPLALLRVDRRDAIIVRGYGPAEVNQKIADSSFEVTAYNESALKEHLNQVIIILFLSLLFLYLYLGAQFESWTEPIILLATIPLSLPGIAIALIVFNEYLHLNSILGIIVLAGLTVNSAILLRETMVSEKSMHISVQRVYVASLTRYKPVFLTTITTLVAELPIVLEVFGKNEQRGMSTILFGGLLASTALSLFVIPLLSLPKRKARVATPR